MIFPTEEIKNIICEKNTLKKKGKKLIKADNNKGGRDNITAILVKK